MAEFAAVVPDEVFAVVRARERAGATRLRGELRALARAARRTARGARACARPPAALRRRAARAARGGARARDGAGRRGRVLALFCAPRATAAAARDERADRAGLVRGAGRRARALSFLLSRGARTMAFPAFSAAAARRTRFKAAAGGSWIAQDPWWQPARAGRACAASAGPTPAAAADAPAARRRAVLAVGDARPFWGAPGAVAGRWRTRAGARRWRRRRGGAWTTSPPSASSR